MARLAWRLAAALLLLALAPAHASEPYSFERAPGKLSKTVVPESYDIALVPDLETLSLRGSELVAIDVRAPTDRLVLNAVAMDITAASLEGEPGQVATIGLDEASETASLSFPRPLGIGSHRLRITFVGRINSFGRGLFFVDYPSDAGRKRLIASHLEPADARRIFPAWDEPAFKARFRLTVTVPERFLAVSNMPVEQEQIAEGGMKRVTFETTPKMSSYLFVLVAGELERVEATVEGTRFGIVFPAGRRAEAGFALDSARALLAYYNDYFGLKYPLPKLDLIAIAGGIPGAMENWGGILFYEPWLLFDPAISGPEQQRGIFAIIAHEMAHLWFGDLVTMGWWDDLWLNEGFATWMQAKAADRLHPDWRVWEDAAGNKQFVMAQDARRTSHPIQQPVANESEAMAAFDSITYSKGQAFIRLLETYVGEAAFRDGIRRYMTQHAYGNASTEDLWRALESASGKPVTAVAASFTEQPGLPLVLAEAHCAGNRQTLTLRQERFTIHDAAAAKLSWRIPVAYAPPAGALLLSDTPVEVEVGGCGTPVKLNFGDTGYYRVQYAEPLLQALLRSFAQLSAADQANLLSDGWALAQAGRLAPERLLDLFEAGARTDNRAVLAAEISILGAIDRLERGRPERNRMQGFARRLLQPAMARLGWERRKDEPADRERMRNAVIAALGELGDAGTLGEARRRFLSFIANPASLRPSLRPTVLRLAGRAADAATYDALLAYARRSLNATERAQAYNALASATDPRLAQRTLAIALGDELPPNLASGVIGTVASAGEQTELAWRFVQNNLAALAARQGPQFRSIFTANLMANFVDHAHAVELASFAPAHETAGGRIVAARAEEAIVIAADLRSTVLPAIDVAIAARPDR